MSKNHEPLRSLLKKGNKNNNILYLLFLFKLFIKTKKNHLKQMRYKLSRRMIRVFHFILWNIIAKIKKSFLIPYSFSIVETLFLDNCIITYCINNRIPSLTSKDNQIIFTQISYLLESFGVACKTCWKVFIYASGQ